MSTTTAIKAAIQELNGAINSLSRFPATDKSATAALLSSTTAQALLRDALKAAAPANAPAIAIPTGELSTFSLISELWERAAPDLDHESLVWFVGAIDQAENVAVKLQEAVEGIGCLMGCDTVGVSQAKAGDFQSSNDAPALLFAIAHAIDNIRALILVGDAASHRLWRPELYR